MSEPIEENTKFTFSNFLNICGALIILSVVTTFLYKFYGSSEKNPPPIINRIEILCDTSNNYKNKKFLNDLKNYKDSLNIQISKLEEIKQNIKDQDSRNGDLFKIIGTVFAIVGFFGFKTIHDGREAALKNAVIEARSVAEKKAKEVADFEATKIAGEKAEEVADKVAKVIAKQISELETAKYLDEKFPEFMQKYEQTYNARFDENFENIEERLNKIEHPEAYGLDKDNIKIIEIYNMYMQLIELYSTIKLQKNKENGAESGD